MWSGRTCVALGPGHPLRQLRHRQVLEQEPLGVGVVHGAVAEAVAGAAAARSDEDGLRH